MVKWSVQHPRLVAAVTLIVTLGLASLMPRVHVDTDPENMLSKDDPSSLRPHASYKITDRWVVDGGANIFFGTRAHTQFSQLDQNSNLYMGLRYSF